MATPPLIAIIDDDLDTLVMLEMLLAEAGYRTFIWARGKGAFNMIRATMPDLVILDMWMEEKDTGEKVMTSMQLNPETRHIPVILCSAYVHADLRYISYLAAKGYQVQAKPFDPNDLLAKVRDGLGARQKVA